jgi:serine/threonine-protein kinase
VDVILAVAFFGLLLSGLLVARLNLKAGRGDTKGAFKLAVFVFSAVTLARLIDAHHVPKLRGEIWIVFQSVGLSLIIAAVTWVFYIALEPFLRRRWSELLISWSRLMAGDFRDPLVGRDILVGGLLGLCCAAADYLTALVPQWSGVNTPPLKQGNTEALSGVGGMVVHFLHVFAEQVYAAIILSFLLLLLLVVVRKKWLAAAALWLIIFLTEIDFASGHPWIFWLSLLLTTTFITLAAARFGLLALYSLLLFAALSSGFPITSDFSSWYAGSTLFAFVVLVGLAIYGFHTSLAGQPLLKGKLLED